MHSALGTLPRRVASESDSDTHIPIGFNIARASSFVYSNGSGCSSRLSLGAEPTKTDFPRWAFILFFFPPFGFVNFPQRIFVDARTVTIFHKLSTG